MKKRRKLVGVLLIAAALFIMGLPVSEADAATSASDFVIEGSTLVKYRGTDTNVSVPDTVESVGESAFEDNTRIELVVLPNSVKEIGPYAFWGCDNLDTVVLGRGLTEVGDYAFAGCKGLEQMSIPANVISIGIQAFGDCVNMTDISIPAETLYIHDSAFDGCGKLTIHCDAGTAADTFAQAFYEKQKEMPEYEDVPDYGPEDTVQEDTVTEPEPTPAPVQPPEETPGNVLGSTSVVGNRAVVFLDTGELNVMETEPENAGNEAGSQTGEAEGMTGDVPISGSVESISKYTVVDGRIVADQAYYKSGALEDVVLPEGIEEIGQFSFARSSVTGITLPEGVTDIGYGAFYHCDSLASVELPDTLMNVEPKAFDYTAWVENFRESGEEFLVSGGVLVAYNGNNTFVEVPGGVRVIGAEVFAGHEEIESVRIPDSARVIGEAAFEGCTGLRQVNLGEGVEQIKDRAFSGCGSLEVLKLPESVNTLGLQAAGTAEIIYGGEMPEQSYEASATRLSNESYRGVAEESGRAGVTVTGIDPAAARLEGAARSYTLTVSRQEESSSLEAAWERVQEGSLPDGTAVYELELTDSSRIPITKLGNSGLTVVLPVPDSLKGQELRLVTLDRNGQLEALAVERVLLEDTECFCFRTLHLSVFAVYGTGEAEETGLREVDVDLYRGSGLRDEGDGKNLRLGKLLVGGAVLITGFILLISHRRRKFS